jgi:ribosome biogenesis GTPase A
MPNRRKPVGNRKKKEYLKRKRKEKRGEHVISKNTTTTVVAATTKTLSSSILRSHYTNSDANRRKKQSQEGLSRQSPTLTHKQSTVMFRLRKTACSSLPFFPRPDSDTVSPSELDEIETKAFQEYLQKLKGKEDDFDSLLPFEKNLEVWRQLWRVFEQWSDLAILVADVRCPLLYLPEAFVRACSSNSENGFVIVLSKCDLVPLKCVLAWQRYLNNMYGDECVAIIPFVVNDRTSIGRLGEEKRLGQRRKYIRETKHFKTSGNNTWTSITLDVLRACGVNTTSLLSTTKLETETVVMKEDEPPRKIAVYGLPSAGKSTLMNAMAGQKVTSTSATPGHTKHIQTWYIQKCDKSSRVAMLCDSPGLVVPRSRYIEILSSACLDMKEDTAHVLYQLLGIIPFAQIREPYSAVRFMAERFDLSRMYGISSRDFPEDDDDFSCSPYALCEAMAKKRQWRVSKSHGRYDAHRAGLEFIRDVATGVFPLWFYPPEEAE